MEFKFELNDLKKIIYWTICKFNTDKFHYQGTSEKSDLIGGFFDRWVNRASEFIIFKNLLRDKPYEAVIDWFFYGPDTEKNAPDILGLQDKKGKVIAKFVEYQDGDWKYISGPWVEVKTNRKAQSLVAVRQSQMNDDHYYVIVESDIRDDYLVAILEDSVFIDKMEKEFAMSKDFIKSDVNKSLIFPPKLAKVSDLGHFKLIGIFKGDELKKHCILCKGKTKKTVAESPSYIIGIKRIKPVESLSGEKLKEGLTGISIRYKSKKESKEAFTVPIAIKYLTKDTEIKILKTLKSYIIIFVKGKVQIDDQIIETGFYEIDFKSFTRNSSANEYVCSKTALETHAKDYSEELISKMDKFFKNED
jgi:hypothetical protein